MTADLLETIRDLPKCSPYLHVPLQSGSDAILQRMKRGYSVQDYRDMMDRIAAILPEAAVASDFITGFCGETEEDHQQSMDALREFRFKNSFIFKYSERPGTSAAGRLADDVPYPVKQQRNNELLAIQNQISAEENEKFVGHVVEVLVEGPSKNASRDAAAGPIQQLTGRLPCDRIVVFDGNQRQVGKILPVVIYDNRPHTLLENIVTEHIGPDVTSLQLS